jgi:multidrug efflux pump subunit AcrA (membrane-fusion protein)
MTYLRDCFVIILIGFLTACGSSKQGQTFEVKPEAVSKTLYFTGTVEPLQESPITSPMEAIVQTMPYQYGQYVKKGEEIFTLNSAELQKQYNDTLTEYLKAKDSYSIAKAKFAGTEDLWQAGLLAKNNYLSEKSSLNTMRVSLMQATGKLSEMLEKMGETSYQDLSRLSFADFENVRTALAGKHNLIHLKAPNSGVLLYPPKTNDDKTSRITVGAPTKAGQVIALIGDLSGIRIEIDVPEMDIDKIKPGLPATIRGVAFKQELKGKLITINAQASATSSGALPSFTAIVEVTGLDKKQQTWIKIGMSASIELSVSSTDKLVIPIKALHQKNGKTIVYVVSPRGSLHAQPVQTGPAFVDKVIIESGLKAGDIVSYGKSDE